MRRVITSSKASTILFLVALPLSFSSWAQSPFLSRMSEDLEENPTQIREDLLTLQTELARIESESDAYDPAVAELSLDIANRLTDRGLYVDALVAYRRALHVLRINEGLNSENQIPIIESMVEAHYLGGEFDEAGENLERLSQLYSQTHGAMNPEIIPHLMARGDWHLGAYYFGFGSNDLQHLSEAYNAYSKIAEIRESNQMPYKHELYQALTSINYKLASELQALQEANRNLGDSERAFASSGALDLNSYRRGKRHLERALNVAKASPNQGDEIIALVQLGDWEQLFRKRFTARETYLQAYQQVQQLEAEHELATFFDTPRSLPDFDISQSLDFSLEDEKATPVLLTFDVSAWGTCRNVALVTTDESVRDRSAERSAIRKANTSIFRPAIVDGEPVRSENVSQTIVVSR